MEGGEGDMIGFPDISLQQSKKNSQLWWQN